MLNYATRAFSLARPNQSLLKVIAHLLNSVKYNILWTLFSNIYFPRMGFHKDAQYSIAIVCLLSLKKFVIKQLFFHPLYSTQGISFLLKHFCLLFTCMIWHASPRRNLIFFVMLLHDIFATSGTQYHSFSFIKRCSILVPFLI